MKKIFLLAFGGFFLTNIVAHGSEIDQNKNIQNLFPFMMSLHQRTVSMMTILTCSNAMKILNEQNKKRSLSPSINSLDKAQIKIKAVDVLQEQTPDNTLRIQIPASNSPLLLRKRSVSSDYGIGTGCSITPRSETPRNNVKTLPYNSSISNLSQCPTDKILSTFSVSDFSVIPFDEECPTEDLTFGTCLTDTKPLDRCPTDPKQNLQEIALEEDFNSIKMAKCLTDTKPLARCPTNPNLVNQE